MLCSYINLTNSVRWISCVTNLIRVLVGLKMFRSIHFCTGVLLKTELLNTVWYAAAAFTEMCD
jgi:hypothetical protein